LLVEFRIRNFALVDDIVISFGPGLNILTGETGSGKSVIVTALSVLLGAKPSGQTVRAGFEHARLDALFHTNEREITRLLQEAGIEPEEDGSLALCREFSTARPATARINNNAAPLSLLRNIAERLVDLHGQYSHQTLLRSSDHAVFLDSAGGPQHRKALETAADSFHRLRQARARLSELRNNSESIAREAELLRFRIDEIDGLIKAPEEYEALVTRLRTVEHSRELAAAAHEAYECISRSAEDSSALNTLAKAAHALARVQGIDPALDEVAARIEEADAVLDTAARALNPLLDMFSCDPEELEELQERDFRIKDTMKKAGCRNIAELFEYRLRSIERLAEISVDETGMEKIENEAAALEREAAAAARKLTESRKKISADFGKKMRAELKQLDIPGALFDASLVPFDSGEEVTGEGGKKFFLRETGAERVEFLISTNPGEPPAQLARIASGGEISRVMLAFKCLLRESDSVPVMVFDEIDTGIGGETANSIARKMATLAEKKQVVSITHLPQIAAAADRHLTARKQKASGRTVIRTAEVSGDERVREMSRMLGATGVEESESLARRMIDDAAKFKKNK